jgi:hypothetical protein
VYRNTGKRVCNKDINKKLVSKLTSRKLFFANFFFRVSKHLHVKNYQHKIILNYQTTSFLWFFIGPPTTLEVMPSNISRWILTGHEKDSKVDHLILRCRTNNQLWSFWTSVFAYSVCHTQETSFYGGHQRVACHTPAFWRLKCHHDLYLHLLSDMKAWFRVWSCMQLKPFV